MCGSKVNNAMQCTSDKNEQEKQTNGRKEEKEGMGHGRARWGAKKRKEKGGGHGIHTNTKGRRFIAYHVVSICQQDDDEG